MKCCRCVCVCVCVCVVCVCDGGLGGGAPECSDLPHHIRRVDITNTSPLSPLAPVVAVVAVAGGGGVRASPLP